MDALYFPYLNLPSATWVNPSLLFFDRLAIITPEGAERALFDRRTLEMLDRNLVRPETPQSQWSDEEDQIFLSYVFGRASNAKPSRSIARVHAGKLSNGQLAGALTEARLLVRADDGWLEGPEWVVSHLMSYLALQISEHSRLPLPLITNELAAASTMVGPIERTAMSRRVRAVTKLLPVPADAQIRDIEEFRNRHRQELLRFRSYIDRLIIRDSMDDHGEASFAGRLAYAEEVRAYLQGEMRSFDWAAQAVPISITAVSAAAAPLDHAPWTLGAGLFGMGILGAQALALHRRRGRALKNRMVYAANVADRWPKTTAGTLW